MTERIDSERAETECSGQEDGVGVEHKKKEQNEHEPDEEPKKKKKKVKHSSKERVWKKKEGMPVTTAVKSPLKSPPALVSPTPTTAGTTADDVFTKEQAIKGNQLLFAYAKCSQKCDLKYENLIILTITTYKLLSLS